MRGKRKGEFSQEFIVFKLFLIGFDPETVLIEILRFNLRQIQGQYAQKRGRQRRDKMKSEVNHIFYIIVSSNRLSFSKMVICAPGKQLDKQKKKSIEQKKLAGVR